MSTVITEVPSNEQQQPAASSLPNHPINRLLSLDVLRGIAVLAGLFVSIWIFGGFSTNQQNGLLLKSKGFDYRLFGTVSLLAEGKMRALIALVFGAGMVLILSRRTKEGELPAADFFMRRQLWLLLFGLINAVLFLWTDDLLFHLAIMGILLLPFTRLSYKGLLIAALLTTLIYSGKYYWNYSDDRKAYNKYLAVVAVEKRIAKDSAARAQKGIVTTKEQKKDTLTKKQKEQKQAWEGMLAGMKYDNKKDDGQKKALRSLSYGKIWNHLLPTLQAREAQWTYQLGVWDLAGMIFLGMALLKLGFFSYCFPNRFYLLLALTGITVGLLLGWWRLHHQQLTLKDYTGYINRHWFSYMTWFPFERFFLATGYASLVIFLLAVGFIKRFWQAIAAAGQMALTNYLLQTIICTFFFYGYGAGYYGRLSQQHLYFVAAEIVLVQIVFSIFWMRHYTYGPAEWLWHCLIYKKWLPNRKLPPVKSETMTPVTI